MRVQFPPPAPTFSTTYGVAGKRKQGRDGRRWVSVWLARRLELFDERRPAPVRKPPALNRGIRRPRQVAQRLALHGAQIRRAALHRDEADRCGVPGDEVRWAFAASGTQHRVTRRLQQRTGAPFQPCPFRARVHGLRRPRVPSAMRYARSPRRLVRIFGQARAVLSSRADRVPRASDFLANRVYAGQSVACVVHRQT